MKVQPIDREYLETLSREIAELRARVKALEENQFRYFPVYDSMNFPADPVEGQVCIAPIT